MKSLLTLLLTCLFLFGSNELPAQETEQSTKGDQQLTSNYFDFYFINGYALAYKFSATENSALRLQLDFSRSFTDMSSSGNNLNTQGGSNYQNQAVTNDSKSGSINISLFFQYILNIYSSQKGQAYIGAGPFLSYSRYTSESTQKYDNIGSFSSTSSQENNNLNRSLGMGLGFLIGIEGYLSDNITVFAETQLAGGKSWGRTENNSTLEIDNTSSTTKSHSESNQSNDNWYYNLTNIRIGIGISI